VQADYRDIGQAFNRSFADRYWVQVNSGEVDPTKNFFASWYSAGTNAADDMIYIGEKGEVRRFCQTFGVVMAHELRDTDEIIPARYLNTHDPKALAQHCMEDADPEFPSKVQAGDIIVGGSNFGCGSSREHAPIAIKACDIPLVISKTFARIFFRNCINIGLPILECPEVAVLRRV